MVNRGYVVLSLFNGCSGAYMALSDLDINISKYYSSDVDKYANKAASLINPDTIHLGDVRNIEISDFDVPDIIFGGFPCKNLSFAGGKDGLIYDSLEEYLKLRDEYLRTGNDDLYLINGKFQQSILFWEYLRILKEVQKVNQDVMFFAENVRMDKKYELMVNTELGLKCQHLNSNLVSAQNRHRLYWTNITTRKVGLFGELETYIKPPVDRKIFLKDIIEDEVDEKYYIKNPKFGFEGMDINNKSNTVRTGGKSTQSDKHNFDIIKLDKGYVNDRGVLREINKSSCLDASYYKGIDNHAARTVICVAMRGRNPDNPSDRTPGVKLEQILEPQKDGKTNCITSVGKDNLVMQLPRGNNKGGIHKDKCPTVTSNSFEQNNLVLHKNYIEIDYNNTGNNSQGNRYYKRESKGPTLGSGSAMSCPNIIDGCRLRRLTPRETMLLQTVPKKFQEILLDSGISDSQLYKMQGNGWTIEMIKEYLKNLKLKL